MQTPCAHPASDWYSPPSGKTGYCRGCKNDRMREVFAAIRTEVLQHYGGKCECCGEANEAFLILDHENGDGAEHRRSLGGKHKAGIWTYKDVKRRGFPAGFRVLCANCNMAIARLGSCPHERL